MIDLARVDHRLQPWALGGGALDRQEQRQQARLVGDASVFAQRTAERQVLRPGLRRELRRVGRQKRERSLIISAVLGEIEVHAADEMPCRALTLEKVLDRPLRFGEFGSKRCRDLSPQRFKNGGREVLGAGHRRRGRGECFEFLNRGRRYWRVGRLEIGMHTDRRNQPRGEVAPVAKVCWKRRFRLPLRRARAIRGPSREQMRFRRLRERPGRWMEGVVCNREQQVAARRQRQRRHEDGSSGP